MATFKVIFYEKENGECPIEELLSGLDLKMRAKVVSMMELLEERGNELREPYSSKLNKDIFELRCKTGSNIVRALYFFYCDGKIVFMNTFVKKTQKTPKREIELSFKRRADYLRRIENENT